MIKQYLISTILFYCLCFYPINKLNSKETFHLKKFAEYNDANKEKCLPMAEKGNPDAQLWMSRYYKLKIKRNNLLTWVDDQKKARREDKNLIYSLHWLNMAGKNYLKNNQPFQAFGIIKEIMSNNTYNIYQYDERSKSFATALMSELIKIKIDRQKLVRQLLKAKKKDRQIELLKLLSITISNTGPFGADVTRFPLMNVSKIKGEKSFTIIATFGKGDPFFCGTGIANGGLTSPSLKSKEVNLVMIFTSEGILIAQAYKFRNSLRIADANNDGVANELIISRNYFNYGKPPYLAIYDLSKPSLQKMVSLTFNEGNENTFINKRIHGGPTMLYGNWIFRQGSTKSLNNIVIAEKEKKEKILLIYMPKKRTWNVPKGIATKFWKEGLISIDPPLIRMNLVKKEPLQK